MNKVSQHSGTENIHDSVDSIAESIKSIHRAIKNLPSYTDPLKNVIENLYNEKRTLEKLENEVRKKVD